MNLKMRRLNVFVQRGVLAAVCGGSLLAAPATPVARAGVPCNTYLPNPEPAVADRFGKAVAISGDVAAIGAEQDDTGGLDSGSIYTYRRNGSVWQLEQTIPNPALVGPAGDGFGTAVAVDGDVALFGAPGTGVGLFVAGVVYVFRHNGSAWLLEQAIPNPTPAQGDQFGSAVAIDGNVAVVGARADDTGGLNTGAAYIYRYDGSTWQLDLAIPNPDPASNDSFGHAVAVSGDVAVVGVYSDNPGGVADAGSIYVYRYDGTAWLPDQMIPNPHPQNTDWFGHAVAVNGDLILAGAPQDKPLGQAGAGSVYAFRYNGTMWLLEQAIPNPQSEFAGALDNFGHALSLSGNAIVISAYADDIDLVLNAGAVYIYRFNGAAWVQDLWIPNPDPEADDYFGWSVGISGDAVVAGVHSDDLAEMSLAGSAYIFDPGCSTATCCAGDFDADNIVAAADITSFVSAVLAGGPCAAPPACCPGDLNADSVVDGSDVSGFVAKLMAGGACP